MKKYERLFLIPAMIVIVAFFLSGFREQSSVRITESLLEQRTSILQQIYLGRIEQDKAEQSLAQIETYPLLTEDIKTLRETQETDFDFVKSMEFLEIKQEDRHFHLTTLFVRIRWHLDSPDSDYISDNDYMVVIQSSNSGYLLSQFEPATE